MIVQTQKKVPVLRFPGFEKGWEAKPMDKIVNRVSDPVDVKSKELYEQIGIRSHGKGIFYKDPVTGESLGKKRVFWVKPDVFIVNIVFAWEQAVAKTTNKEVGMIASHRFPMYQPIKDVSDLDFILDLFLTNRGKYLLGLASPGGAGRNKTLGQKEFAELKIKIPSFAEQQKIAEFLTSIDIRIQQLTRKVDLLEQYKKGVMQQIFSQEIRFKDDQGRDFPDWEEKSLGNIGTTYNGLTGKTKENFGEGKPYINYKQIFDNSRIDIKKFDFVEIASGEKQSLVKYGDVFFTTSSETPREVGFASVLLDHVEELYLNSFCFGYRPKSLKLLLPGFARFLFRSEEFRKKVYRLAQGSTRYNLSKREMMKLEILLPTLPEQQKIADFLTAIDQKITHTKDQLDQMQTFKKGLLQQMFV